LIFEKKESKEFGLINPDSVNKYLFVLTNKIIYNISDGDKISFYQQSKEINPSAENVRVE